MISDDAGELDKAVQNSQLARGRILDWFHIAIIFKAAENSMFGSATIEPLEREAVTRAIDHAKWLDWHGKGRKSVCRIKGRDAFLLTMEGYEHATLYWNLRRLYFYIDKNHHQQQHCRVSGEPNGRRSDGEDAAANSTHTRQAA